MVFAVLLFVPLAQAQDKLGATIFDLSDAKRENPLAIWDFKITNEGPVQTVHAEYKDTSAKLLLKEVLVYKNDRLQSYVFDRVQTGERVESLLSENSITAKFTKDGKTKEETLKRDAMTFTVNEGIRYIRSNWARLEKGEKIAFQLFVPDRLETISFTMQKKDKANIDGALTVVWTPSAWVVRRFVRSPEFTFDLQPSHKLLQFVSQMPIRKPNKSGHLEKFDGLAQCE